MQAVGGSALFVRIGAVKAGAALMAFARFPSQPTVAYVQAARTPAASRMPKIMWFGMAGKRVLLGGAVLLLALSTVVMTVTAFTPYSSAAVLFPLGHRVHAYVRVRLAGDPGPVADPWPPRPP